MRLQDNTGFVGKKRERRNSVKGSAEGLSLPGLLVLALVEAVEHLEAPSDGEPLNTGGVEHQEPEVLEDAEPNLTEVRPVGDMTVSGMRSGITPRNSASARM